MEMILQSNNSNLLTRKEAAIKLRISLVTLDKLVSKNTIPAISIGRRVFISEDQINAFINKGGAK